MTDILFFFPATREMRYINPINRPEMEKLEEKGWAKNPTLFHFYHPVLKKWETDMAENKALWEAKGYITNAKYIYHPTDGTKLVSVEDAKRAYNNGWYDSPAKFPGNDIGKITTPNISKEAA